MKVESGKIGIILQARMGSERLPGKMLALLAGKALLGRMIDLLKNIPEADGGLVVATSNQSMDDPIAEFCKSEGVEVFRGALDNVYSRFARLLEEKRWEGFVRICGDSPLHDSKLIGEAIRVFREGGSDFVTNVFQRTYPRGRSVEVFRSAVFLEAEPSISGVEDQEHVTSYFYRNSEKFTFKNLALPKDFSSVNLCVDTSEDLVRMESLIGAIEGSKLGNSPAELAEFLAALGK